MPTQGYIRYRSDYKHQLAESYQITISIRPRDSIKTDYIDLDTTGILTVKKAYAWDGPSGPVVDTPQNLRASLVHDALYQLMRNKKMSSRTHRKTADQLFLDMCKQDGVPTRTANLYYMALRKFGKPAAAAENKKKTHQAPATQVSQKPGKITTQSRKRNTYRSRKR